MLLAARRPFRHSPVHLPRALFVVNDALIPLMPASSFFFSSDVLTIHEWRLPGVRVQAAAAARPVVGAARGEWAAGVVGRVGKRQNGQRRGAEWQQGQARASRLSSLSRPAVSNATSWRAPCRSVECPANARHRHVTGHQFEETGHRMGNVE